MQISIHDLSRSKSALNLTYIASKAGIKPGTLLSKVQNNRELTVVEANKIYETLESMGIILVPENKKKESNWLDELVVVKSKNVPTDLVIDRDLIYEDLFNEYEEKK
jgi:hypothetical protein